MVILQISIRVLILVIIIFRKVVSGKHSNCESREATDQAAEETGCHPKTSVDQRRAFIQYPHW